MSTLFPLEPVYPEGFTYVPDFITQEEENELIALCHAAELNTFVFHGYEAKRKVKNYGYSWSFTKKELSKAADIPSDFHNLLTKVSDFLKIPYAEIAQFLIIQYDPGTMINWHRDAPPFDIIIGISLLSDCTFKLRRYENSVRGKGPILSLPVKRRSMYVMKDEVRSEWMHSVSPVKELRYSITLRTLR